MKTTLGCCWNSFHGAAFSGTCPDVISTREGAISALKQIPMPDTSRIREHMDVISSDRKTVGKVDHLDGSDKIKLTKQSSPDGQHHHVIPLSWVDHVDQHVHLNKSGSEVT